MTHLGEKINKTFKWSHLDLQGVLDGYPFRVPPKDPPTKHCRNTTANRTQLPSLTPATRAGSRRCTHDDGEQRGSWRDEGLWELVFVGCAAGGEYNTFHVGS